MRLDESPFKNYQKADFEKMLEDYNAQVMKQYPNVSRSVKIWDESLRDGEQSPGVFLKVNEKIHLAKLLDEIGVKVIAAGFPAVSKDELSMVKAISKEKFSNASIAAVSRTLKDDIDAVLATECEDIIFFVPLSDLFLNLVLKKKIDRVLDDVVTALTYSTDHGLHPSIVAEDASRAKIDYVLRFFRLGLDHGASRLVYADTVGVLFPETTHMVIRNILDELNKSHKDKFELAIHVHNDFGLATANTFAGVLEGVVYPHVCINGYGERAGNCALEEVAVGLEMNGIKTGIKLEKIAELSKVAEEYFGIPLTSHKPIVGGQSFAHESGIHISALLMHPLTYEPIPPKKVGRQRQFYLGKFSGISSIQEKLSQVGMQFPRDILHEIVELVKQKQEKRDKEARRKIFHNIMRELDEIRMGVSDAEFWEIVRSVVRKHEQYQDQVKDIPKPSPKK
nr:homoaconitate hydratase [Candidatus Sigynarchaeota archaeon]